METRLQDHALGRFDKSFLIHMIKDFFLVLLLVMIIEFALKAGKVYWDYHSNAEAQALEVAEELSDNVISIMRNSGGPVAASTMYPILDKNWKELGYEIAIEPSAKTLMAIEDNFSYSPIGIPKAAMADGEHRAASVDIKAVAFCTSCHSNAAVGEVLGTVTVRNYLGRDFEIWWEGVKLTLGLAVGKIVLHSILLFLILRARMEPLLRLRSVVSCRYKVTCGYKLIRWFQNLEHLNETQCSVPSVSRVCRMHGLIRLNDLSPILIALSAE